MSVHIDLLKKNKIRVTPQRLAVFKILEENGSHMTAELIYEELRKQYPSVSLATVYSTLEVFKEQGLIAEIRIDFDRSCFEARVEPHHHFFCRKCAQIYDIDIPPCSTLEKRQIDGNLIEYFQGYFYGVCKLCQKTNNNRGDKRC